MSEIDKLLRTVGVLPESPIGRLIMALDERVARLEAEVLPQDPPPEFFE